MKASKVSMTVVAILSLLGLAGCGHQGPEKHPLWYYLKHPKLANQVADYCQKHKHLSKEESDNCQNAYSALAEGDLYGSPDAKSKGSTDSAVSTNGGTMDALSKALSENPPSK